MTRIVKAAEDGTITSIHGPKLKVKGQEAFVPSVHDLSVLHIHVLHPHRS